MEVLNLSTVTRLKNGEFLQFMKNVITVYSRNDVAGLKLDKRLMEMQSKLDELEAVFQTNKTHELTAQLKIADDKRIKVLRALRKTLESILLKEDESSQSAGLLMENYLFHANKLNRFSLPQKTACIDALKKDWLETPNLLEAMNTLGLSDWMTLLQKSNDECNEIYVVRVETSKQSGKIQEKRAMIKSLFDELVKDTEAHYRLAEDNVAYTQLLQNLNSMIQKFSFLVNVRKPERKKVTVSENVVDAFSEI